jgi:PAS domain S-box-containing protein
MKIGQKLLLILLASALVPLLASGIPAMITAQQTLRDQIQSRIDNTATHQTQRVQELEDAARTRLNDLIVKVQIRLLLDQYNANPTDSLQVALTAALQDLLSNQDLFKRIHLLSMSGKVIASTESQAVGRDYAGSEVFQAGSQQLTTDQFFKDTDGALRQYLTGPLQIGNRKVGVLVVEGIADQYVYVMQDYTELGRTGESYLIRDLSGGKKQYLTPLRFKSDTVLSTVSAADALSDYRGHDVVLASKPLEHVTWGVVAKIDLSEVEAPLVRMQQLLMVLIGLAAVAAIVGAWYLSRAVTAPITRFTRVVEKIRGGDLNQQVDIRSHDEIGTLGIVFNEMTAKIKHYYEELEAKVRERTQALETAQLQLQQNVKQDEALLGSIGDSVMATDRHGYVIWINKSAEKMLKLTNQEILGKRYDMVWQLETEKGEPVPPEQRPILRALTNGQPQQNADYYYVRKDAQGKIVVRFAIAVNVAPVFLDGQMTGAIVVFRDITHEREVDRMKTEFISLASHQLRTPLSAIRWFSEMLLAGDAGELSAEQQEFTKNISDSTKRMTDLVGSLLDIARIESGRIMINPQPTDLAELINGIVTDLKGKTSIKQQQLVVSVHKDLPKINVDPQLVGQVYLNLLTNAIKYTPKGGEITVLVSRKGEEVVSQVADNGYGIPPEEQDKMFQKFFRATNIIKVESDGTGLGMYLVKAIVESSGGRIWFESEVGKGTTFWFTLPMSGMKAKAGEVTLGA